MHLKKAVYKWFEPTLKDYIELEIREEETDLIFGLWVQFEIALKQVFDMANEERNTVRTIH